MRIEKNKDRFINPVNYIKVKCECGRVLCFLRNHSMECKHCGRLVYPSKECEFKERMKIKLRKELSNNE
jgi:hypothetical protein